MSERRGFFGSDTIERVRMATEIAAIVGRYVDLKAAGRNMKGICPFHKEKTPSFFVSPERQTYHCFGCGAGGDVFSFLMNYLSYSFSEAVEELASEAGIRIEYEASAGSGRTELFREIMTVAQAFYRRQFRDTEGRPAREYLAERSISTETADAIGTGWAPPGSRLSRHLRDSGYSESVLVESGLSLKSSDGSIYDRFRERLIFPIGDRRGRIISFGGRILSRKSDAPKYINGPDSPIYSKGDYLYGYHDAAPSARDLDMIILVEGYFDHARLFDAGFACTVATCGTALTPSQARQLGSLSPSIYICYDGDGAGRKAAVRAAEVILRQGHLPKLMHVPDGMDPDDYIRESGPDGVLKLTEQARDPIRFALGLLGEWSDIRDSVRRVKAVSRLTTVASAASSPVVEETLLKIIASETGYSMDTLRKQIDEDVPDQPRRGRKPLPGKLNRWDSAIIAALLLSSEEDGDVIPTISEQDMRSETGVRILREIRRQREEGLKRFQPSLLDEVDGALCAGILAQFPDGINAEGRSSIETAVTRWRLERQLSDLKARLLTAQGEDKVSINRQITDIGSRLMRM